MSSTPSTRTTAEDAIDIAHAALVRNVLRRMPGLLDEEEARQDLALYILERLDRWDPERGKLSTFVHVHFDQWWRDSIAERREGAAAAQTTYDPSELWMVEEARPLGPDAFPFGDGQSHHEVSSKARELLDMVPTTYREPVAAFLAHGVPRAAAAEMAGVEDHQVRYQARAAIKRWRKHLGVEQVENGPPEGHVTATEARALTGLSAAYLAELRKGVAGPAWVKRGRRIYYGLASLTAWNEARLARAA